MTRDLGDPSWLDGAVRVSTSRMRIAGLALALMGPMGVLSLGTSCILLDIEPCRPGLALGDRLEIELIEPYVAEGPYTWDARLGLPGARSCAGRDGLGPGTYAFDLVSRRGPFRCWEFGAAPVDPIWDLDFSVVRTASTLLFSQVAHCGGYWQLVGYGEDSALGQEAIPGRAPPLVVHRTISDTCGPTCVDAWVAEIRHLGPAPDASTLDGGAR